MPYLLVSFSAKTFLLVWSRSILVPRKPLISNFLDLNIDILMKAISIAKMDSWGWSCDEVVGFANRVGDGCLSKWFTLDPIGYGESSANSPVPPSIYRVTQKAIHKVTGSVHLSTFIICFNLVTDWLLKPAMSVCFVGVVVRSQGGGRYVVLHRVRVSCIYVVAKQLTEA